MRKLRHEIRDPAGKTAVKWALKIICRTSRRKGLENGGKKIISYVVTPQATWPIAKSLMKKYVPK
jgi:hypothetical protein